MVMGPGLAGMPMEEWKIRTPAARSTSSIRKTRRERPCRSTAKEARSGSDGPIGG